MRVRILLLVLSCALGGCSPGFAPIKSVPVVVKNYASGGVLVAAVGEPIFRVQQARSEDVFVLEEDYRASGRYTIEAGTRFTAVARSAEGHVLLFNPDIVARLRLRFVVDPESRRVGFVPDANSIVRWITKDAPVFRRLTDLGNQPGAFTAELIYSGLAGGVVRAVYREYIDNLARPAFSQDLQYDISADRVIAYRSIRIRVVEATNAAIRYEVVEDGGLPWLPDPSRAPSTAPPPE